jgi:hypothetical protein
MLFDLFFAFPAPLDYISWLGRLTQDSAPSSASRTITFPHNLGGFTIRVEHGGIYSARDSLCCGPVVLLDRKSVSKAWASGCGVGGGYRHDQRQQTGMSINGWGEKRAGQGQNARG